MNQDSIFSKITRSYWFDVVWSGVLSFTTLRRVVTQSDSWSTISIWQWLLIAILPTIFVYSLSQALRGRQKYRLSESMEALSIAQDLKSDKKIIHAVKSQKKIKAIETIHEHPRVNNVNVASIIYLELHKELKK